MITSSTSNTLLSSARHQQTHFKFAIITLITIHQASLHRSIIRQETNLSPFHWLLTIIQCFSTALPPVLGPHDDRPLVDNAATTFQLLIAVHHTQQYQRMVLQHDKIKFKFNKGTPS